jgi:hypothetical protein
LQLARAAVIGHLQNCSHSNHDFSPQPLTRPQKQARETISF